jgi:hypothetical protein
MIWTFIVILVLYLLIGEILLRITNFESKNITWKEHAKWVVEYPYLICKIFKGKPKI